MVACSKLNSHAGIVIPNPAKPLVLGVDCLKHVVSDAEPGPGPAQQKAPQGDMICTLLRSAAIGGTSWWHSGAAGTNPVQQCQTRPSVRFPRYP